MFGIFKKKAKAAQVQLHKVENRDLMEAIVASSVLVAFADGDCSAEELETLDAIIASNDNLSHFGSEIGKTIDKYSAMYEAGARLAKVKLMKEIRDVDGDETQKEEAFVIAIEIADADGEIDDAELKILKEIGKALGLNPESYI
ncbi:tellurite resistance protein [Vibrio fortis]|uniref:Tellurite resistance protein n=1 Tax=Vibrio fortis TaxID=212667 RepID=A0A5N3QW22_9VIBR|nr:TerB family tellurite resistance protein [Vibrio fortis]KAB0285445.1 tellurite resistance protein [Vibrio fortis]